MPLVVFAKEMVKPSSFDEIPLEIRILSTILNSRMISVQSREATFLLLFQQRRSFLIGLYKKKTVHTGCHVCMVIDMQRGYGLEGRAPLMTSEYLQRDPIPTLFARRKVCICCNLCLRPIVTLSLL